MRSYRSPTDGGSPVRLSGRASCATCSSQALCTSRGWTAFGDQTAADKFPSRGAIAQGPPHCHLVAATPLPHQNSSEQAFFPNSRFGTSWMRALACTTVPPETVPRPSVGHPVLASWFRFSDVHSPRHKERCCLTDFLKAFPQTFSRKSGIPLRASG